MSPVEDGFTRNYSKVFDYYRAVPETEGIKYIGSKLNLLGSILSLVDLVPAQTVLDGFSGSTRVSQALAKTGHRVICNDTAEWSKVFGLCYLCNYRERNEYQPLIEHLNNIQPEDGWYSEHYGGTCDNTNGRKKPWQIHNTRKLDGIRAEIDRLELSVQERAVALTSLILALDAVDNTLGHFSSYLHDWAPRSYNTLELKIPQTFISEEGRHKVLRNDIFETLAREEVDLAYFDPPYGSNNEKMPPSRVRYAAYYHLWTTICLNDQPDLFGRVGRRMDSSDTTAKSPFEDFRKNDQDRFIAVEAIARLLREARVRWIILSYSSGGRATREELQEVLVQNGRIIKIQAIDYKKNVMAAMTRTGNWVHDTDQKNKEYLFLLEKD